MLNITIDEKQLEVAEGTTILEAARAAGIEIPTCVIILIHPLWWMSSMFSWKWRLRVLPAALLHNASQHNMSFTPIPKKHGIARNLFLR